MVREPSGVRSAARARQTAPEAGAVPKLSASFRLRRPDEIPAQVAKAVGDMAMHIRT